MKATKPAPALPTYCRIFSNKIKKNIHIEVLNLKEICKMNYVEQMSKKCFVNCSSDTTSVISELCKTLSDKSEGKNTKCMKVKK